MWCTFELPFGGLPCADGRSGSCSESGTTTIRHCKLRMERSNRFTPKSPAKPCAGRMESTISGTRTPIRNDGYQYVGTDPKLARTMQLQRQYVIAGETNGGCRRWNHLRPQSRENHSFGATFRWAVVISRPCFARMGTHNKGRPVRSKLWLLGKEPEAHSEGAPR